MGATGGGWGIVYILFLKIPLKDQTSIAKFVYEFVRENI